MVNLEINSIFGLDNILTFKKGGGIHIKKKNRGKFTKSAKAAGESVQEHAAKVLSDPNATPLLKKRANFARNAVKWKHLSGGILSQKDKNSLNKSESIESKVSTAIMNLIHRGKLKPSNYPDPDLIRDGGVPQRTYLLSREELKKEFLNAGYIEGKEGDYGLVRKAVGDRNIPIYQREPDAAKREDLVPIGNIDSMYYPKKGKLIHAGHYPTALYYNYQDNKLYLKAWDLNDYGGNTGYAKKYNFLQKLGVNILDKIGSPTVVTSGFLEIPEDVFYYNLNELFPYLKNFYKSKGLEYDFLVDPYKDTPTPHLPEIVVTNKLKKYAGGGYIKENNNYINGYVRDLNNHPISFDTEGNLVDLVSGEKGTMILPGFNVIGISPKTRAKNYSSAYDRYALPDLINYGLESTIGKTLLPIIKKYPLSANILKAMTPSSYIGTLREGKAPWDLNNTGFGDSKDMQSANLLFDLAVGPKVFKGANTASKLVGKGLINSSRELPYLFPKTRLYSDNPFINAYATLARRYNLPDKARLPYLIRKIKNANLNFTEDGLVDLTGSRWKHTNYTYDLGVIPHAKGSWDDAALTLIINPRNFIKRNKWGNIEPSDMFTVDDTTPVSPKEVINITTSPMSKELSKAHGIQTFSTKTLENIDQGLREVKDKARKLDLKGRLFNPEAMILRRRQVNREKYDAVLEIINKFGRPKVKDVRLLEETTGLKSYIHPIEDALLFRQIDTNTIWTAPIDLAEEIISKLPTFNNGRRFNYKNSDSKGVQYPYRNFFYDPATTAESKFQFPLSDAK